MQRKIAWVSILLLLIGMLGGCKKGAEETTQIAGSAAGFVQSEDAEEMIPPADQPEAEEPPKAGETIAENKQETTTEDTEKTDPPQESTEPEATEPEATEPEEEIDLNAGNRFSPRKRREPGYDKYYCDATIDDEFEPGKVYVCLKNEVSYPNKVWPLSTFACVDPVSAVHTNYYDDPEVIARKNLNTYTQCFEITLKEKTKEAVLKAIRELEKLDIVYFAEPAYTYSYPVERTISNSASTKQTSIINNRSANADSGYRSNDSYVENQYAIDQIKLPAAWNISVGTNSLEVGVIDTGMYASHLDLYANAGNGINFTDDGSSAFLDEDTHGTHVAGILGAVGNNGRGIAGSAWQVDMITLKVYKYVVEEGETVGDYVYCNSDLIQAINRADQEGIKLLNFSGGGDSYNSQLEEAIGNFSGLIVVSAGNVEEDKYTIANNDVQPMYPASYDCNNIISVCNVDWNDQLAQDSHYGATSVDLAAPGESIYSTLPDDLYGYMRGTSMAAPYVTGVAALIWSVNPNLTPAQVKAAILNSVDPVAGLSGKCVTGGRLNAYKALTYALTEYDSDALTGDINGDGREDLLFYRGLNSKRRFTVFYGKADGSFEQASTYYFSASSYSPSNQVFLGDVNGDGKKEVIVHWSADSYRKFTVYTYSAASDSFTAARLNSTRLHNPTAYPNKFFVADVDGDQKEDFIVHWRTDAGKRKNLVYKGLIRTDGLACFAEGIDSAESTRTYVDTDPVFVGDVNGDGRSDLVIHWALNAKRQLLTYTANSDGTFSEAVNFSSTRTHNAAEYPCRLLLEDVNGDNKEDFIVHWKNAQDRRCFLVYNGTVSSGKATFQEGRDVLYSTRTFDENDAVYTGDFNGDGRTDLLVHWEMDLKRQLLIYFATSSGGYNEGVNISTPQNFVPWDYPYSAYVLDANGDNKDDFVVRWTYGTLTSNEYGYNHTHTYKGNASGVDATVQTTMIYSPFYDYRA